MKYILGLTAAKETGKTTTARAIRDLILGEVPLSAGLAWSRDFQQHPLGRPAEILSFAAPIHAMGAALGRFLPGFTGLKDETVPVLGVPYRNVLQTLGTEWGRDLYADGIWVDILLARLNAQESAHTVTLIDDCRFANEAQLIRRVDGCLVRLERGGVVSGMDGHRSEQSMAEIEADAVVQVVEGRPHNTAEAVLLAAGWVLQ
jgi:hypothetical protein